MSLDSFVKKNSFQKISFEGIQNIGLAIECMAEAEQLFAHKNAVTLRLIKTNTMIEINKLVRKNILELVAYSSARDEFSGKEGIFWMLTKILLEI